RSSSSSLVSRYCSAPHRAPPSFPTRRSSDLNVLSQGFDVPDVSAVYVCRPTFVPNRYLQMIGRGLRGPLNGGTERVDIVNVKDKDRKSTRLNSSHVSISYAVFCLKKKTNRSP